MVIGALILIIFQMGSVVMLILTTKDFKHDLKSINRQLKKKENRVEIAEHFTKLIRFHSDIKELSLVFIFFIKPYEHIYYTYIESERFQAM